MTHQVPIIYSSPVIYYSGVISMYQQIITSVKKGIQSDRSESGCNTSLLVCLRTSLITHNIPQINVHTASNILMSALSELKSNKIFSYVHHLTSLK
jgi:hypothetical protein